MEYLHEFETQIEFEAYYDSDSYVEPFIGLVTEVEGIHYNKVRGPQVTALTINNLVCLEDIPGTGGTVDASDCTYTITAYYDDESSGDVTTTAVVEGSFSADETYITSRHIAGSLTLTASMDNVSGSSSVNVYQQAGTDYESMPLTIEIISAGTLDLYLQYNNELYGGYGYYTLDGDEWIEVDEESNIELELNAGDKVQIKGYKYAHVSNQSSALINGGTAKYKIYGNVLSLFYVDDFYNRREFSGHYGGYGMFSYSTGLIDAKNLVLNIEENGKDGNTCSSMFYNCTNLVTVPKRLPSTNLPDGAYYGMFESCTSLANAPELPATELTESCYCNMFKGCTSLTTAPELPATELTEKCYQGMFYGCTHLNYIKCLSEEHISDATYTSAWTYNVASSGTFVKAASGIWDVDTDYRRKYWDIPHGWNVTSVGISLSDNIIQIAESGGSATITVTSTSGPWSASTSNNWIHISQATGGTGVTSVVISIDSASTARYGSVIFRSGIYAETLNVVEDASYDATPFTVTVTEASRYGNPCVKVLLDSYFYGDYSFAVSSLQYRVNYGSWQSIPQIEGEYEYYINVSSGDTVQFRGPGAGQDWDHEYNNKLFEFQDIKCQLSGRLMSLVDMDDLGYQMNDYEFSELFDNCSNITSIANLTFPGSVADYCYYRMFRNCGDLVSGASILPATTLAPYCYYEMFDNCSNMKTAPELPATALTEGCYKNMFSYCYLDTAPELPAAILAPYCYEEMFYECYSMYYIKCLATDISASSCTTNWLYDVASEGTFVKSASMSNWEIGSSDGIPTDWTVENE